jgi:hypothetical protein
MTLGSAARAELSLIVGAGGQADVQGLSPGESRRQAALVFRSALTPEHTEDQQRDLAPTEGNISVGPIFQYPVSGDAVAILSEVAVLVVATCSVPQLYNWADRPTDLSPYYNRHVATLSYWLDEASLIHLPNLGLPPKRIHETSAAVHCA